jgi:hypothetical protein
VNHSKSIDGSEPSAHFPLLHVANLYKPSVRMKAMAYENVRDFLCRNVSQGCQLWDCNQGNVTTIHERGNVKDQTRSENGSSATKRVVPVTDRRAQSNVLNALVGTKNTLARYKGLVLN